MKLRVRIFLSHLATVAVVLLVVSLAVRGVALNAVHRHMGGMRGMMMGPGMNDIQEAVVRGVNLAVVVGALAGVALAVAAAYLVSGWISRPISHLAGAARRIARGEYGQRVAYGADDEIGGFTRAFNEMAGRLEETESIRRELLATISHELRTPLTNIQGYMEGLMDGVVPAEPQTYQLVRGEATRLARLVTEIERLSRLEAGAERIEPRALETRTTLLQIVEGVRPQMESKELLLRVEAPEDLPAVWADADKLTQVLLNLLANSLKYTGPGDSVTVSVRPEGTHLRFSVEDTGAGIPAEDLPHIFERFYRVDKSRSAAGGGAGIGLAVVKSLVEQMGGAVEAESEPGKFTRISFTLPSATARSR
jgi:signal transduction histidine kinase